MRFRLFLAAQALIAGVLVALAFSQSLQQVWMEQFHLTSDSYPAWYALQPYPRMYNFKNDVWYCPQADSLDDPVDLDACMHSFFNHYPARSFTFGQTSRLLASRDGAAVYVLRSTFQGHTYQSRCLVGPSDRGNPHQIECREQGDADE